MTTWVDTVLAAILFSTLSAIPPLHHQSSMLTMALMLTLKTQGVEIPKLTSLVSSNSLK